MDNNTDNLLEAILDNQNEKMTETNALLEAGLERENLEPLLEASLESQNEMNDSIKGTAEAIRELKPAMKQISNVAEFVTGFMQAIKGDKGDKGETGESGKDGADGQPGKDGADGQPGKDGADGQPGKDGYTPVKGVDYFTEEEIEDIISKCVSLIPTPKDGEPGKDAEVDYDKIISEVVSKLPKIKKQTEKTPDQIAESIKGKLSYNDLKDLPTIFKGMAGQGYLKELADVNVSSMVDGQALIKSGDKFIGASFTGSDEKVKLSASDPTAGYLNDKLSASSGVSYTNGVIANTDKGSTAVSTHQSTYDHTKLHDPVTAGTGISVVGQQVTNSAPDQTVAITSSSATVTGTYPNFNIEVSAGSGDVTGPASAVADDIVVFDGVTGKIIKDGGKKVADLELVANKSTSVTADGASDVKYPSVKAVKDYADGLVVGLLDYRGAYDASGNTFPATGGSGTAGAVLKGDMWVISVAGTLGGQAVQVGDSLIANIDTPGQTAGNWNILNGNIAYVPEDVANKVTSISGASTDTQYPSAKLVYDQLALKSSGPASATDNAITRFDGTTGKLIQNSTNVILDNGFIGINNTAPLSGIHLTGTGVTPTAPTGYSPTDQQKSQTIGVQGSGSAYFFAEDVTNDIETAFGASTNGNGFVGTITADAFELRTTNTSRVTLGAAGGVNFNSNALTGATTIDIGNADTTLSRTGAGDIAIEGKGIYRADGTDVAIADGGTGASTAATAFANLKQDATESATGVVELATVAEVNTGTDATRAITPDALAGSNIGTKNISIQVLDGATDLATGDGKAYLRIPAELNGMNIVGVAAQVIVKSSSGNPTFMITRGRQANATSDFTYVDVLSTAITIDANEYDSKDATTAAAINTSNDDLATGDVIRIDIDGAGTSTKGLNVTISCRLP